VVGRNALRIPPKACQSIDGRAPSISSPFAPIARAVILAHPRAQIKPHRNTFVERRKRPRREPGWWNAKRIHPTLAVRARECPWGPEAATTTGSGVSNHRAEKRSAFRRVVAPPLLDSSMHRQHAVLGRWNAFRCSALRCRRQFVRLPRYVGVDVGEREVDADLGHQQHAALGMYMHNPVRPEP
jgi:hypothetical protein